MFDYNCAKRNCVYVGCSRSTQKIVMNGTAILEEGTSWMTSWNKYLVMINNVDIYLFAAVSRFSVDDLFMHILSRSENPRGLIWNSKYFNAYFMNIGPSLDNQIDKNNIFRKYLQNASESRIIFWANNWTSKMKIKDNLKNKTITGFDGISNQLLKLAKYVLVKPIITILNQMIVTDIFSDNLKISKFTCLYKVND